MSRCNEAIDKLFVLRSELQFECFNVAVPLRFCTRTRDGAADNAVLERPCESERNGSRSTLRRMIGESLCDLERFRSPLGLLDSLVAAACARVGRRLGIHCIFAAKDATREWAVRDHTKAVVSRRRQLFNFRGAVDNVVERFARDGAVNSHLVGETRDFGNAPATEIG